MHLEHELRQEWIKQKLFTLGGFIGTALIVIVVELSIIFCYVLVFVLY